MTRINRLALALARKPAYKGRMKFQFLDDRIFYPAAIVVAVLLILISLVWPQGLGLRSPPPFGHPVQLPDYFRMVHDQKARQKKLAADKVERERAQAAAQASADALAAAAAPPKK